MFILPSDPNTSSLTSIKSLMGSDVIAAYGITIKTEKERVRKMSMAELDVLWKNRPSQVTTNEPTRRSLTL